MKPVRLRGILIPGLAAVLITGLLLLLPDKVIDAYDLARMHQCYKSDLRAIFLTGEMPWWNPYTALGRPFLADIETATLYPPSWLVIPLGVTTGIVVMIWLHLMLAIEGTRKLGEFLGISRTFALVAGVSFGLSGALLGRIQSGQLQVFCVICLWPWVWLSALRLQDEARPLCVAQTAGWFALAFLAGSPQILWCGLVVLGALLVARASSPGALLTFLFRLGAAGILATGLLAVQLFPFIELIQQGNRPLDEVAFASQYGESALGWMTLMMPPGWWWNPNGEYNVHGGALFFIFACAAMAAALKHRNVRALTVAGLCGVILSLGDRTVVLPSLAEWVPGFAGVRLPSRYALGTVLVVSLLGAWWLDHAFREKRLRPFTVKSLLCLHAVTLILGLYIQEKIYRLPKAPANETRLMADLKKEGLPRDGAPPRVALPAYILRANAGAQCGVSTLTGFNNPALLRTWTTLYLMANEQTPNFNRAEVLNPIIAQLAGKKSYFSLSAVWSGANNEVYFAPPPLPRAYLSFSSIVVPDWKEAVKMVRNGHDFGRTALVESTSALMHHDNIISGHANIKEFSRNRVVVECSAPTPALLTLAEAWYPGWVARINDGSRDAVIPVNGWMRGIQIPAGNSRVTFEYRPSRWGYSILASGLSCLVALGLSFFPRNHDSCGNLIPAS